MIEAHPNPPAAPRAAGRAPARRTPSRPWLAAAAAALLASTLPAQAQDIVDGMLLIASDEIEDPNFARAVVLVLRHDDDGTVGVVLNRPTRLEPATVFPELAPGIGSYTGKLYRGGPVSPTRVLFLVRGLAAATVQGPEVVEKVFLSGDPESLADIVRLADGTDELRIYAGHAEWVPRQLAAEIAAGGWRTIPGTAEIVFHADVSQLWAELANRGDEVVARVGDR